MPDTVRRMAHQANEGVWTGDSPTDPAAARAQAFFARLAFEARRPSFGDRDRDFVRNLLLRAEEAGLYRPKENV